MKIIELFEGPKWNAFKKSVQTGYDKAEKAQQQMKRSPIVKAAKGFAKFAANVNKAPPRS